MFPRFPFRKKNSHIVSIIIIVSSSLLLVLVMVTITNQNYSTLIVEAPFRFKRPNLIVGNLEKFHEHHIELETHRYQMSLSSSSSFKELYQLMARQYDVPVGLYKGRSYKKILFWNWSGTMPVGRENSNFGVGVGRDRFQRAGCPVWQCETSENRSNLLQYDAIIFSQVYWNKTDVPKERSPNQRYIFYSHESPGNQFTSEHYPIGFFNWTMTYRWDSDVVHPYGWIEPLDELNIPLHPSPKVYEQQLLKFSQNRKVNYAAGKTKFAVFFVSNCESKSNREELTILLTKHGIKVDVFGGCGNMTCGVPSIYSRPQDVEEECLKRITPNYKFFLAFHNAMCQDYTPERFYNALRYSAIPIVMDAHGNHARAAPPHSFINVLDFPSIEALAHYLIKLDSNDTLYNEYFWWKDHYKLRNVMLYEGIHYRTYCSMCAALHNPSLHSNEKKNLPSYNDIKTWWRNPGDCKTLGFNGMYVVNQSLVDTYSYKMLQ